MRKVLRDPFMSSTKGSCTATNEPFRCGRVFKGCYDEIKQEHCIVFMPSSGNGNALLPALLAHILLSSLFLLSLAHLDGVLPAAAQHRVLQDVGDTKAVLHLHKSRISEHMFSRMYCNTAFPTRTHTLFNHTTCTMIQSKQLQQNSPVYGRQPQMSCSHPR